MEYPVAAQKKPHFRANDVYLWLISALRTTVALRSVSVISVVGGTIRRS